MGAMDFSFTGFSLNTNLIPALQSYGIDFRSVYATICKAKSIIVMYAGVDICRVEANQDVRTNYSYKVSWVHPVDGICFPSNYKHYTELIKDIKTAIKYLKNGGKNKMDNKMYKVTAIGFNSNPCEKDEINFTVRVMRQRDARQEDVDRIREAIESIKTHDDSIDALMYCKADIISTYRLVQMFGKTSIKDVIFNNPATIVLWADGTKTVVKAENEEFDPEKGLAMAITKKALGNGYDYYDTFKKYVGRYEKKQKKGDK